MIPLGNLTFAIHSKNTAYIHQGTQRVCTPMEPLHLITQSEGKAHNYRYILGATENIGKLQNWLTLH